jgi:hypothetical protein
MLHGVVYLSAEISTDVEIYYSLLNYGLTVLTVACGTVG